MTTRETVVLFLSLMGIGVLSECTTKCEKCALPAGARTIPAATPATPTNTAAPATRPLQSDQTSRQRRRDPDTDQSRTAFDWPDSQSLSPTP